MDSGLAGKSPRPGMTETTINGRNKCQCQYASTQRCTLGFYVYLLASRKHGTLYLRVIPFPPVVIDSGLAQERDRNDQHHDDTLVYPNPYA